MIALNQHLPPHSQGSSADIKFTELDIPRALSDYSPSLPGMAGFLRPTQAMVNMTRKEIAEAANKDPPFLPFIAPKLSTVPWRPDTTDHNQAISSWKAYAENRKTGQSALELSIQSFLLFQLRFVLAADVCQARLPFGGIAPQLAHLPIILDGVSRIYHYQIRLTCGANLSVVESVGVALSYHQALMTKLAGKARQRTNDAEAFARLMSNEQFELRGQTKRDVASSANVKEKAAPPVKKETKAPPPAKKEQVKKEQPSRRQDSPRRSRSPRRRTRSPQRMKLRQQPQQQPNRRDARR